MRAIQQSNKKETHRTNGYTRAARLDEALLLVLLVENMVQLVLIVCKAGAIRVL